MKLDFKHDFLPVLDLKQVNAPEGRYYETPDGNFRSVTTILGDRMPKSNWIEQWKARVGEDQANRILVQAGNRGTAVHDSLEKFLLNDRHYLRGQMPVNIATIKKFTPHLEERVSVVRGLEHMAYSKVLKCAGSIDCIAYWDNIFSIVDFKTSRRMKKKEDILSYFYQATAYALMVRDRFGITPARIVILMAVDDEPELQIFVEKTSTYARDVVELFRC